MKYKKSMFVLVLVIFLFSFAAVSASDVDDTVIASEDAEIELSSNSIETDNLKTNDHNWPIAEESIDDDNLEDRIHDDFALGANENSVLKEGEAGSFTDLNRLINVDNKDNDTITLNGNYKYVSGDEDFIIGINIARSLTIDGNGATLDGSNSARILRISTSDKVILKNINFINGKAEGENVFYSNGGAIYDNSGCTIENCNFTNNYANYDGGAVYGHNTITILRNCTFTQNRANAIGGAASQSSAINCTFNENSGRYGGALGVSNALNCIFNGNSGRNGGAMYLGNAALCTFKTGSDTTYNTNIDNATLNISNLNNEYNFGDKLIFDLIGAGLHCDGMKVKINIYYLSGDLMGTYYGFTGKDGGLIINFDYGEYLAKLSLEGYAKVEDATATINVTAGTTFSDLNKVINDNENDTIILEKNYAYNSDVDSDFVDGITINRPVTINGNGYTIDAKNLARIFQVTSRDVVLENITFINGYTTGSGGAVYFSQSGRIINCNFTNNSAYRGGAVYLSSTGNVTNCNFADNTATYDGAVYFANTGNVTNCDFTNNTSTGDGGAIRFMSTGTVTNCNFTDNSAQYGGAVRMGGGDVTDCNFINNSADNYGGAILMASGTVSKCNFINNTAEDGGAIRFNGVGTVTNCNFTDNNATTGSAIYFYSKSATKTVSNSRFLNNRANAEALEITKNDNNITITFTGRNNLLNAIYSRNDAEVTFTNVTYWGADGITTVSAKLSGSNKAAGQNITVKGVVNGKIIDKINGTDENGEIVLDDAGDYWIIVSHKGDLYYTEIAETLFTNMKLYANVTSLTTNNKTVNITAKSNIYSEVMPGKLLFILPNGTQINATYGANGTWWALHEFDKYDVYQVNATYVGLDNVTINNGTITINKLNSTITLDNIVLDYGETKNITVTAEGATGIVAKIDENEAKVDGFVISIPALDAGTYILTVTAIADKNHNNITKNAKITVNKLKTELTGSAITTTYNVNKDLVITLKDSTGKALSGVKVTVDLKGAKTYTTDKNGQVKVSTKGIAPKAYTAKVTFNGDTNYGKSTKDIKVTVKKATPKLTAKKKTFKTTPKTKKYTIVLKDNTGKAIKKAKVTLKVKGKTYKATTNSKGKATFKITKLNKKGTFKATITYKGNKYYNKVSKKANIKVIVTFKTVSKGSKDKTTVKEIQQALKDKGYYLTYQGHYLKVDGKFKGCTERSLKEFQKDKGLKVTGKVDEKTARKLGII